MPFLTYARTRQAGGSFGEQTQSNEGAEGDWAGSLLSPPREPVGLKGFSAGAAGVRKVQAGSRARTDAPMPPPRNFRNRRRSIPLVSSGRAIFSFPLPERPEA